MAAKWKLYWLLVVLTLAVYAVMVLWSLPKIAGFAGGLVPFDMRPTGYDAADVQAFLAAISPEGVKFYLGVQHCLDTAYPAMLAAVLAFGALGLAQGRWRLVGWVTAVAAIAGAVFDYVENLAIAALLRAGADGFGAADVARASQATLLKSGLTTIAVTLLLILIIVHFVRRKRRAG